MTVCALMVVRDEADIIRPVIEHTLEHVDEVLACDHRSSDGTRAILYDLDRSSPRVTVRESLRFGFYGDEIRTWLAAEAFHLGHDWGLIVDADDVWYVADALDQQSTRVGDILDALPADWRAVSGFSYNHVPTGLDATNDPNPLTRIGWRRRDSDALKVACRLRPDLRFRNHNAWYDGVLEPPAARCLAVRHFTIRTAGQLVRKVEAGIECFQAEPTEGHDAWDEWLELDATAIRARFEAEFWAADPRADASLIYDPAPVTP